MTTVPLSFRYPHGIHHECSEMIRAVWHSLMHQHHSLLREVRSLGAARLALPTGDESLVGAQVIAHVDEDVVDLAIGVAGVYVRQT